MPPSLRRLLPALVAALALPASAGAAEVVPGEVVVKREGEAPRVIKGVEDVERTVRRLEADGDVAYAAPNPVARAAAFVPNDPGFGAGWQAVQWNFGPGNGVNAPEAWQNAIDAGNPGGAGVKIAVLDSEIGRASCRKEGRYGGARERYMRKSTAM